MPITNINHRIGGITLDKSRIANTLDPIHTAATRVYSREDFSDKPITHYNRPEMYAQPAFRDINIHINPKPSAYITAEITAFHDNITLCIHVTNQPNEYIVHIGTTSAFVDADTLLKIIDAVASL